MQKFMYLYLNMQGWRQEFSDGRPDSADEGTRIRFSRYYKCQHSSKNRFSPSDGGLACSDGPIDPPLVPPL